MYARVAAGPRPHRRHRRPAVRPDAAAVPLVHGRPARSATCSSAPPTPRAWAEQLRPAAVPRRLPLQAGRQLQGPGRSPRPSTCSPRTPTTSTSSTPPGVDGEGVQVGDGEVDWALLARQLDEHRARRRLHPRDLAGPRQRRRGVLDRPRAAGAVVLRRPAPRHPADRPVGRSPSATWAGWPATSLDVVRAGLPGWRLGRAVPARTPGRRGARGRRRGGRGAVRPGARAARQRALAAPHASSELRPRVVHTHLSYADIVGRPRHAATRRAGHHRARHRRRRQRLPRSARAKSAVMAPGPPSPAAPLRRGHRGLRGDPPRDGRQVAPAPARSA